MLQEEKMTQAQIDEEMRQLRKVFVSVRLIPESNIMGGQGKKPCYAHWKRTTPCENCVAKYVLESKESRSKLEYMGKSLYEVIANYVEVDGKPCVLEMARRMDRGLLLGPEDSDYLLNAVTSQKERRYRDVLTGAYNRKYYDENYSGRRMTAGVALLDLDDLRLSNDVYGRSVGDIVLETAANVVRRSLEKGDKLIRYGGDELLILLPDIGQERFNQKLEQIRMQLNAADVPGYSRIRMSASIGGIWVENGNVDEAVKHSARLMQYASLQKNTVVTEHPMQPGSRLRPHCRQSVLIVDDSMLNRTILSDMLSNQYDVAEASSGEECLRLLEKNPMGISVVLLDIHMTGIDGFAVLETMNRRQMLEQTPVIVISTEDTVDAVRRAFDLGASDYISRPFDAKVVYQRISNTIRLYAKQRRLSAMVADQLYGQEARSRLLLGLLSRFLEQCAGESREHLRRVRSLTGMLLSRLVQDTDAYPLPQALRNTIATASVLHDIGKMELTGQLPEQAGTAAADPEERLRQHTLLGEQMVRELNDDAENEFVQIVCQICRWHHERYDGSGYPDGLSGNRIPIAAQVVGLADTYETLIAGREDGQPVPHRTAVKMLREGACGGFDPLLLNCLEEIGPEIVAAMADPEEPA